MEEETEQFEKFLLEDNSNDKLYFTILPNSIFDTNLSAIDIAVYSKMKRVAGETGECFMSQHKLASSLRISKNTLKESIKELLAQGLIYSEGSKLITTKGGMQTVIAYKIRDIWAANAFEYNKLKGGQSVPTLLQRGVNPGPKVGQNVTSKNNTIKNIATIPKDAQSAPIGVYSLNVELKKLEDSKRRDINVIGFILEEKTKEGLDLSTKEKFNVTFKRYLRAAKDIQAFSDDEISNAMVMAKKEYPKIWTGETLLKLLTK
jgi:DNA-binding Lrp family transcriptional regulator